MITNLQLKNFTAFTELSIDFSPGINIVIGENGTGKTQLLKAILALSGPDAWNEQANEKLASKLCRIFQPLGDKVGELRRAGTRGNAVLGASFASGQKITAKFSGNATAAKVTPGSGSQERNAPLPRCRPEHHPHQHRCCQGCGSGYS